MSQKYKVYVNNCNEVTTDNLEDFLADHELVEAAGGLVYNDTNQLLMIFRDGKWDLPKGKLEFSESIQECAIREVEEECGVFGLTIINQLTDTYHTYMHMNQKILKRTYWFNMKTKYKGKLIAQISEGITRVEWFDKEDVAKSLENSHKNIVLLINEM